MTQKYVAHSSFPSSISVIVFFLLHYQGIKVQFLAVSSNISLLQSIQTNPRAHPAAFPSSFPKVEWMGLEADHSSPSGAEVETMVLYITSLALN